MTDSQLASELLATAHTREAEDIFFQRVGPGRMYFAETGQAFQPHEFFRAYQELLNQIRRIAPRRYATLHKGTPFYYLGWLAYEIGDYESGLFYMDAGLSEDIKNNPDWETTPASAFLFLDDTKTNASAHTITKQMREEMSRHMIRYSQASGKSFTVDELIDQFVKPNSLDHRYRSITTSLITFLLEGKERKNQLSLRSKEGGSLEPFLTHLFKGGLVFESILKLHYSSAGHTLGAYLGAALNDLGLTIGLYRQHTPYSLEGIPGLLTTWQSSPFEERSVAIAYAVRNTAGHDLGWQDIFSDDTIYTQLFEAITDAIFLVIHCKYPPVA